MRNAVKKTLCIAMAVSMVGLAACQPEQPPVTPDVTTPQGTTTAGPGTPDTTTPAPTTEAPVEKPAKITVMADGTIFTQPNGRDEFERAWEGYVDGVDLVINQPDHSQYADQVSIMFATNNNVPDVMVLSAGNYAIYAQQGSLADITPYWESSDLKSSGRLTAEGVIDGLYIDGSLFGFAATRGNGCITYIKQAWLDKVGLTAPKTWDDYFNLAKAFTENDMDGDGDATNDYGVSAPGFINFSEAPYTNYLPEVYQSAYPDFYEKDGVWVDGFGEQAMADGLQRLQDLYLPGYLDVETPGNNTKACRDKFTDERYGIFTYWAGTWCKNLTDTLTNNGHDGTLVAIEPIAELGAYVERQSPVWAITSACQNPAGVFKYFIDTMYDGGDVQTLWVYGVKGVHWDNIAEELTIGEKTTAYTEGQFHFKENLEVGGSSYTKHHIDPMLAIADFAGENPGATQISDVAMEAQQIFNANCVMAPVIYTTETMNELAGDIWDIRTDLTAKVATGAMSPADAMADYQSRAGALSADVLDSLNN